MAPVLCKTTVTNQELYSTSLTILHGMMSCVKPSLDTIKVLFCLSSAKETLQERLVTQFADRTSGKMNA